MTDDSRREAPELLPRHGAQPQLREGKHAGMVLTVDPHCDGDTPDGKPGDVVLGSVQGINDGDVRRVGDVEGCLVLLADDPHPRPRVGHELGNALVQLQVYGRDRASVLLVGKRDVARTPMLTRGEQLGSKPGQRSHGRMPLPITCSSASAISASSAVSMSTPQSLGATANPTFRPR